MTASGTIRRNRWAMSFADLLLLLLGFFILLQAGGQRRDAMLARVSQQFGGHAMAKAADLRASDLFASGEALLTPQGRKRIAAMARPLLRSHAKIEIRSQGFDPAHGRFDQWDLAAARLGAVARALEAGGIARERIVIRGLDQAGGWGEQGQRIGIARR